MKNTLRSLILGLAAFTTFVHAAPNDDPAAVATTVVTALVNGDADTVLSHTQILKPEDEKYAKEILGEAEYKKMVDEGNQKLKARIIDISKEFKDVKDFNLKPSEITYTNADKTRAKTTFTLTVEYKDGSKKENDGLTYPLIKTELGWKIFFN